MSRIGFHPEAFEELRSAVKFYEEQRGGLGRELALEVQAVLDRVAEWPEIGTSDDGEARKAVLARFPFTLVYRFADEGIEVIAVMHQRRRPGYWRERGASQ